MDAAVYLDHNATTPVLPAAAEAVAEALATTGNPSSVHRFGRLAHKLMEDAREAVALLFDARPSGVVFTSGGSEANNLAIRGPGRTRILVSAVEHPSVIETHPAAETIPVNADGIVDVTALDAMLAESSEPALVSVMLANNETGVVQPVDEVARAARRYGALVHCDAVQAVPWRRVSLPELGVHMMTVSAHKMGGPRGVGALVVADDVPVTGIIAGGGQERGRRAGTENVAGIAGFGVAAQHADTAAAPTIARLRDAMEGRLKALAPEAHIPGAAARRLPNTTCLAAPGLDSETQVIALDLAGVAVSAGAACSSGKVRASHVLKAMGLPATTVSSAIRVSLGRDTTATDVDRFVEAWGALRARIGNATIAAPAA